MLPWFQNSSIEYRRVLSSRPLFYSRTVTTTTKTTGRSRTTPTPTSTPASTFREKQGVLFVIFYPRRLERRKKRQPKSAYRTHMVTKVRSTQGGQSTPAIMEGCATQLRSGGGQPPGQLFPPAYPLLAPRSLWCTRYQSKALSIPL